MPTPNPDPNPNPDPDSPWLLPVTDLKQWDYCPRVVYYTHVMPGLRPITFKMEMGERAHEREARRERRRSKSRYGLPEAERVEDVQLQSERLGLSARIDLVLRQGNEAWPVDYKHSRRITIAQHYKLQLVAYGLILEDQWKVRSPAGFLVSIPHRRAERIPFTKHLRNKVMAVVQAIRTMIETEAIPPPTSKRGRCVNCEFRRFCNDIF